METFGSPSGCCVCSLTCRLSPRAQNPASVEFMECGAWLAFDLRPSLMQHCFVHAASMLVHCSRWLQTDHSNGYLEPNPRPIIYCAHYRLEWSRILPPFGYGASMSRHALAPATRSTSQSSAGHHSSLIVPETCACLSAKPYLRNAKIVVLKLVARHLAKLYD